MKVKLNDFVHEENGLALQLLPETETEGELLKAFLSHGRIESGHPCEAKFGGLGFYIKAWGKNKVGEEE